MTTNVESYFLNLRKQSNNTELQSPERQSLPQSSKDYSSPQQTDQKFLRAVEQGLELNQRKASQITQKKNQRRNLLFSKYDYNQPGSFELAYRVADNLVGEQLAHANLVTQRINVDLMPEQVARKSKKTDNFCEKVDFKKDTFRKLYPGPFEITS